MTHAQAHQRRLLVVDWNRGGWCAWVRRAEEVISPLKADVIAYARRHGYNGVAEVVAIDYYVDADGYTHGYENPALDLTPKGGLNMDDLAYLSDARPMQALIAMLRARDERRREQYRGKPATLAKAAAIGEADAYAAAADMLERLLYDAPSSGDAVLYAEDRERALRHPEALYGRLMGLE